MSQQLIRSTGPLFVAVTFYVVESRQFTFLKLLVLFMTVGGVVLAVVSHSVSFKLDPTGAHTLLLIPQSNNFCVTRVYVHTVRCRHLCGSQCGSCTTNEFDRIGQASTPVRCNQHDCIHLVPGLNKNRLRFYSQVLLATYHRNVCRSQTQPTLDVATHPQVTIFLTPFIFVTGEQKIVANLVTAHLSKFIGCLIAGSVIVILYLLIATYLIQQTNSLFVAIAANFKMVTIILLSELLVENTKLNAGVYLGMTVVTVAFLGSFANDQYLDKVKKADRSKSPFIEYPCLDRLSDPFCAPADPKTDNRQPLCCSRDALDEQEEQPFLN